MLGICGANSDVALAVGKYSCNLAIASACQIRTTHDHPETLQEACADVPHLFCIVMRVARVRTELAGRNRDADKFDLCQISSSHWQPQSVENFKSFMGKSNHGRA